MAAIIDILVGLWIFMSSFAWQHTVPEFVNTLLCGSFAIFFGIGALADRRVRYLEMTLALWLFLSTHLLAVGKETLWNNTICAVALFVAGLMGGGSQRQPSRLPSRSP